MKTSKNFNPYLLSLVISLFCISQIQAQEKFESDKFKTTKGELKISFIGHGTLMMELADKVIHIDPTMREANYAKMPKADLVLITHHHGDHFDLTALNHIVNKKTKLLLSQKCVDIAEEIPPYKVWNNGDTENVLGIKIEVFPAYNIKHTRKSGSPFHPKGEGNAYLLNIGKTRIFIGGDTENIPEIKTLKNIDIAFLPMNLPYTMTPEMVANAAKAFKPKILYPYHFGNTDTKELVQLLKEEKNIEVRIRKLE